MITQFKLYEKIKNNYNVGDWIVLFDTDWNVNRVVKIIELNESKHYHYDDIETMSIKVEALKLKDKLGKIKLVEFWIDEDDIEHFASPKEIEDVKIKIELLKYNI